MTASDVDVVTSAVADEHGHAVSLEGLGKHRDGIIVGAFELALVVGVEGEQIHFYWQASKQLGKIERIMQPMDVAACGLFTMNDCILETHIPLALYSRPESCAIRAFPPFRPNFLLFVRFFSPVLVLHHVFLGMVYSSGAQQAKEH